MSSITAVGVRLGDFGPPPQPPTRSLLKTEGVLQEFAGRELNGVNLQPYPDPNDVSQWNPCADESKTPATTPDPVTFDPVAIFLEVQCTTAALAELHERAVVSLEAGTPKAVEALLASGNGAGVAPNANPFLTDANATVLNGGVAVAPREALAFLEDFIATDYGARGMIHGSPGLIDSLSSILETQESGTIYTQAGTPVVPGQGYASLTVDGDAANIPDQQWLLASSPVEVRLTEITVTDLVSSLDRSDNSVRFLAERYALVTWDTLLQAAVLVDYDLATS